MFIFLLQFFCLSAFTIGNNQVEISADDYSAAIRFYDPGNRLIDELILTNFYGYKITPDGNSLYIMTKEGINSYDDFGRLKKKIQDKGMVAISSNGEFLVCASEDNARIYKDGDFLFKIKINNRAIRSLTFSADNQFLGIMARHVFTLVALKPKQILWHKEFSPPLVFAKISDGLIILATESRASLECKVYLLSPGGEILKTFSFNYKQYDELILDVEVPGNSINIKMYNRELRISNSQPLNLNHDFSLPAHNSTLFNTAFQETIPWPLPPMNALQPLGNNWGNYQNYLSHPQFAYMHPGIDILTPNQQGVQVYAVKKGWIKAWLTTGSYLGWRFGIADSSLSYTDSCDGFLYAHLDSSRYHKQIGDSVEQGELIGYLVPWSGRPFDHIHFAKIRDCGSTWLVPDWAYVFNPLVLIRPNQDTFTPVFENAASPQPFAFCRNNTPNFLAPNNLSGDVDIIAKIYDLVSVSSGNPIWDRLIPYKIEYEITGTNRSVPKTISFLFSNRLDHESNVRVVYKQDAPCCSRGDYISREYYFIVTNTDGDSIIEGNDSTFSWRTQEFPDGFYWVKVYASDISNNVAVCSMQVRTVNGIGIAEARQQNSEYSAQPIKEKEEVYNCLGQRMYSNILINLKPGVYFKRLKGNTKKFIVIK